MDERILIDLNEWWINWNINREKVKNYRRFIYEKVKELLIFYLLIFTKNTEQN